MAICETHDFLKNELSRTKDDIADLYFLDRQRSQDMADIKSDIAEIKADNKYTKKTIADLQSDITEVKNDITEIKNIVEKKKWQPKDLIALASAILSSSLLVAIVMYFLK